MTPTDEARAALLRVIDLDMDGKYEAIDAFEAAIRTEYEDEDGNRAAYEEGWTKAEAEYHLRSDDAEAKLAALRDVQRYGLEQDADGFGYMELDPDGDYLLWRDVAALAATPAEDERREVVDLDDLIMGPER